MLALPVVALHAQTPVENLQKGVEEYNALRTYQNDLKMNTVTDDQIAAVKARMEKGLVLLDQVIQEGNSEQIKTARYFKANFRYQYGYVLGMKGENVKAFAVFKAIENEMTAFTASDFPMRYVFFDKNYIVNWENFASTQAEFYAGLGEIAYSLGKYDDAIQPTRLSLTHPNTTTWLKYVGVNKMLDISAKKPSALSEQERLDFAQQSIKAYDALSDDDRKVVADNNYHKVNRGADILLAQAQKANSTLMAARCAEVVPIVAKYEPNNTKVLQLYEICYRNSQTGDLSFHTTAQAYAQNAYSTDRMRAEFIGVAATERIALLTAPTDCAGYRAVSELYVFWKKTDRAQEYVKKADDCLEQAEKARKKAERAARRANSSFNFYTGAYIIPLLNSNPKRDYGGVVNFSFRRVAWEFSYLKINRNKENIFDLWIREVDGARQDNLSRWDGFYTHIQPKFYGGKRDESYVGILLGYAQKNFDSMSVTTINDLDGTPSLETFEPKVNQYIAMVTFGMMPLWRGFGIDAYWSLGANYSQFDPGNELDRDAYTIDNPLLENRKDAYFGFIMRLGFTMGLNFGSGNQ